MMYNFSSSGKECGDSDGLPKERVKEEERVVRWMDGQRGRKGKVRGRYEQQSRH